MWQKARICGISRKMKYVYLATSDEANSYLPRSQDMMVLKSRMADGGLQ